MQDTPGAVAFGVWPRKRIAKRRARLIGPRMATGQFFARGRAASASWRAAKRLASERKYYDEERAATAIPLCATSFAGAEADPATVNTLCAPVLGSDINQRIGRRIDVLAIKIRGTINVPPQTAQTATDAAPTIRLLLVQDNQTNAAQLNSEDVLESGDATQAVFMFQSTKFFGRFRVLKDKLITLMNPNMQTLSATNASFEQNALVRSVKMSIKFIKPVRINFNAVNGGTVADIIDTSFHVLCGTNSTEFAPTLAYKVRTVYVDV